MTWATPPGPFSTDEVYDHTYPTTDYDNFLVLQSYIGLYGAAGARYAVGSLPSAGSAVQWSVQVQGFNNFTTAAGASYGTLPYATLTFPNAFDSGGGVAYVEANMRYAYNGTNGLTYSVANQVAIIDGSITLSGFDVCVENVSSNTFEANAFSCSYIAVGWHP